MSKTALKWNDEDFWDSSPKFLFKQMELFSKYNKQDNKGNSNKSTVDKNETVVKQKLRVLPPKE